MIECLKEWFDKNSKIIKPSGIQKNTMCIMQLTNTHLRRILLMVRSATRTRRKTTGESLTLPVKHTRLSSSRRGMVESNTSSEEKREPNFAESEPLRTPCSGKLWPITGRWQHVQRRPRRTTGGPRRAESRRPLQTRTVVRETRGL